jgi:DNA-binding NarL/FixJ family response regulator
VIPVLLVDDHPQMRHILREMLETYTDLTVVGEAETGEEAVTKAAQLQPSVVIIDINLPTLNGIQATKLIRLRNPRTAVIILTAGDIRDADKEQIFSAGAAALLNKADLFESLHPSIHEAIKHQNTSFENLV